MKREISHTAYVRRTFDDVCSLLERDGSSVLRKATVTASVEASDMVLQAETELPFFEADEEVRIATTRLELAEGDRATLVLDWQADPGKRVLPHLTAKLQVDAVIPSGPHAAVAVSIIGHFDPPAGLFHRVEELLVTRRIAKAAAHAFIEKVASDIEAELPLPT